MPYKVWAVNEILTAADMNTYVGNQTILSFAGTAARSSAIGTPVEGMLSYVGGGTVQVYAGTAGWTSISGGGGAAVSVSTAAPSTPAEGNLWWDSDDGKLYIYYDDGTSQQWVDAAGPSVAVQATPPTGYQGQLWLDSDDGSMYVYYTDPGGTASSWIGAVSRSGGILQVTSTLKTDTQTGSLASAASTAISGLSASITPRSTSSKILVMVTANIAATYSVAGDTRSVSYVIKRDGTIVGAGAADGSRSRISSGTDSISSYSPREASMTFLDSPATTSSISYTVDIVNTDDQSSTYYVNRGTSGTDSSLHGRGASSITLMEVAG